MNQSSNSPTTQSTGNTAPLDHVLPDDPSAWTALDHAVATANLRGAIIARERAALNDWRCEALPICPTCGTDHSYWAWEDRDSVRGVIRENAALRERVARLGHVAFAAHDLVYNGGVHDPLMAPDAFLACQLDALEPGDMGESGDLDGAGEGEE